MVDYDAELRDWAIMRYGGFPVAVGRIFEDRKCRWPDGRRIMTSVLLTPHRKEGSIIATLNSRYLLVGPGVRFQEANEKVGATAEAAQTRSVQAPKPQVPQSKHAAAEPTDIVEAGSDL